MTCYFSFLETPAKINYDLHILGRRGDGYHLLDSVFLPINGLSDKISVTCREGEGIFLKIYGNSEIPSDLENLAWKAAEKILEFSVQNFSVEIELVKQIPVAAGLGGGSSDAAVVLRLINDYLIEKGQGLSDSELASVALKIGADVPFFLNPQPARVTGIGETIEHLKVSREKWSLLVFPNIKISAAGAYQLYQKSGAEFSEIDKNIHKNDLEDAVVNKYISLRVLRDFIKKLPNVEHSAMSGSGSTWFATFDSEEDLSVAEGLLKREFPWVKTFSSILIVP